jgi:hypothetical protein
MDAYFVAGMLLPALPPGSLIMLNNTSFAN